VLEPVIAQVEEVWCSGCKECLRACPYEAIEFLPERQVAHVVEALCKGCGTCVAACLPKAISLSHFTDEQLVAQMQGLLSLTPPMPEPELVPA